MTTEIDKIEWILVVIIDQLANMIAFQVDKMAKV